MPTTAFAHDHRAAGERTLTVDGTAYPYFGQTFWAGLEQLVDCAVEVRWQAFEHITQVGPGVVPVELRGLSKAHHHCGALSGEFAAGEEPSLAFMSSCS